MYYIQMHSIKNYTPSREICEWKVFVTISEITNNFLAIFKLTTDLSY